MMPGDHDGIIDDALELAIVPDPWVKAVVSFVWTRITIVASLAWLSFCLLVLALLSVLNPNWGAGGFFAIVMYAVKGIRAHVEVPDVGSSFDSPSSPTTGDHSVVQFPGDER